MTKKNYIVYAGDDNFAMQIGISIHSLLENNPQLDLCIYVFSENISEDNKAKIRSIAELFSKELIIIEMPDLNQLVGFELYTERATFHLAKSSYCRLFLSELLPEYIDNFLWIDGDTTICGDISEMFSMDLTGFGAAAILDATNSCKRENGFKKKERYYNAGIFLINLKYWRENGVYEEIINEIKRRKGKSIDHDQSILNCVLRGRIKKMPPQYNLTHLYCIANDSYSEYLKLSGYSPEEVYTEAELKNANQNPVIFHFTNRYDSRPWLEGCTHPGADIWEKYFKKSPWIEYKYGRLPVCKQDNRLTKILKWIKNNIVLKFYISRLAYIRIRYGFWQ